MRNPRWLKVIFGGGLLLQAGVCGLTAEQAAAISQEVLSPQLANFVADSVFFVLDNALVRLTT